MQQEIPAVLSAVDAKALVQQMIAREWSARDRLTLHLPPSRLGLEPGGLVEPGIEPASWIVEKCTVEGFVGIVELRPAWRPSVSVAAEAGRIVPNADVVETAATLALIDAPNLMDSEASAPTVLIAASTSSSGWNTRPLSVSASGQTFATQTAARKSILGAAVTTLAAADPYLIDDVNSFEVELVDHQQWLTSCDDDALGNGVNLAVLGSEIVQFGEATALGNGRFRLAHLLRGRAGSEWAANVHFAGETFCLIDSNSLQPLQIPIWARGSTITAVDRNGSAVSLAFAAESMRPLAPVNLSVTADAEGNLALAWTRRSRCGFAWLDEVDAPIGESREQYAIAISTPAATLDLASDEPTLTVSASDVAVLGTGTATIEVRQLGDWAASRPAHLTIDLQ